MVILLLLIIIATKNESLINDKSCTQTFIFISKLIYKTMRRGIFHYHYVTNEEPIKKLTFSISNTY